MKQILGIVVLIIIICLIYSLFSGKGSRKFVKRLFKICFVYIVVWTAISCLRNYQFFSNRTTYEPKWTAELFKNKSQIYEKNLAFVAAEMSEKSEKKVGDEIKNLYDAYGIDCTELYNYDGGGILHIGESIGDFDGSAFAIGQDTLPINGEDTLILVITARGTQTFGELIGDVRKGWPWEKTHTFEKQIVWDNVYDFEEEIWSGLNDYIKKYPSVMEANYLKILVTGHSLGGVAACMTGARLNGGIGENEWWSDKVKKEDIYVYTFGAIKVLATDDNVSAGYENIHNLYNYYDSYGPNGNQSGWGASSPNAKFGHTDIFYPDPVPEENEKFPSSVNHGMSTYKDAINDELIKCEYIDEN